MRRMRRNKGLCWAMLITRSVLGKLTMKTSHFLRSESDKEKILTKTTVPLIMNVLIEAVYTQLCLFLKKQSCG